VNSLRYQEAFFLEFYRKTDGLWIYTFILMDEFTLDANLEDPQEFWLSDWISTTSPARLRHYEISGKARKLGISSGKTKEKAYNNARKLKKDMIKEAGY